MIRTVESIKKEIEGLQEELKVLKEVRAMEVYRYLQEEYKGVRLKCDCNGNIEVIEFSLKGSKLFLVLNSMQVCSDLGRDDFYIGRGKTTLTTLTGNYKEQFSALEVLIGEKS